MGCGLRMKPTVHISVLLNEIVDSMQPVTGKVIVDGTFGGGGYTKALLDAGAARVIAFDRDEKAIVRGKHLQDEYGDRLVLVNDTFSAITQHVKELGYDEVDGIVLDLGFSSDQLDDHQRGFAFKHDGPLDMRMAAVGETAADVVNTYDEKQLADLFWKYGEEKKSRQVAAKIVSRRVAKEFTRTKDLADVVEEVIPAWTLKGKSPAMRVFQALRIHVNRELEELENVMPQSQELLAAKGRLSIVTFHSLEDRMVKEFFKPYRPKAKNKYKQETLPEGEKHYELLTKKAVEPTVEEISSNSRARSAKLRTLERIA